MSLTKRKAQTISLNQPKVLTHFCNESTDTFLVKKIQMVISSLKILLKIGTINKPLSLD